MEHLVASLLLVAGCATPEELCSLVTPRSCSEEAAKLLKDALDRLASSSELFKRVGDKYCVDDEALEEYIRKLQEA